MLRERAFDLPYIIGNAVTSRVVIAGMGVTEFSRSSGKTILELATEACSDAAIDAGIDPKSIDGFITYGVGDTVRPQAVAFSLAAEEISYMLNVDMGGTAPCFLVLTAAALLHAGLARTIVLWRAMNGRSGNRIGSSAMHMEAGEAYEHRRQLGVAPAVGAFAMWARRYMIETGASYEDIGSVPMTQRSWATTNERAMIRKALTREQYLASEFISDPLRLHDCATEIDGAAAIVLTTEDRAKDYSGDYVIVEGGAYSHGARSGLDVLDFLSWPDLSTNSTHGLRKKLSDVVGEISTDLGAAQIYDCFSINVLMSLEGLGMAERGQAAQFLLSENRPGGALEVNTGGGMISEGYLHGMNSLTEGVRWTRLRKQSGEGKSRCLVTSGGPMWSSGVMLSPG